MEVYFQRIGARDDSTRCLAARTHTGGPHADPAIPFAFNAFSAYQARALPLSVRSVRRASYFRSLISVFGSLLLTASGTSSSSCSATPPAPPFSIPRKRGVRAWAARREHSAFAQLSVSNTHISRTVAFFGQVQPHDLSPR
jgi:hypothetical protein